MRRKLPEPTGPGAFEPMKGVNADGYDVYSWSPDPVPGRSPATAVLLAMRFKLDQDPFVIAFRFKSREAIDQMIDALERHAVDVWPKG